MVRFLPPPPKPPNRTIRFPPPRCEFREGVNREKLTVKKIISITDVFFHRLSLINREKLCVNREKLAPKIHHFFTVSFSPFTSS